MTRDEKMISRRIWLANLTLLMAAGIPPKSASAAEGKASKSVVHYQDYPKENQMCGMCKYFAGHGMTGDGMMGRGMMGRGMMGDGMMGRAMMAKCQVVEGSISPMGWCDLYSPRGT
jgi:hypothetical protein